MPAVTAARVTVIPAKKDRLPINVLSSEARKLRVAAYARVSTNNEEQLTSYEAQVDYYTRYIQSKDEWQFVEVYTDEGISATNTKKRDGFNRMVADALAGKIDLIITKSISRFARNTVDTLTTVRKLNEKRALKFSLKKKTSAPWTEKASCLLPSCPRWRRKKAAPFLRTSHGASASVLQTER